MDARQILARNIRGLMSHHPELDTARKLAARCKIMGSGIGHNTIERMISPDKSSVQPRLDNIVAVARAFKLTPDQLLNAALDPANPCTSAPPPQVIEIARKMWANRELLLPMLGPGAISDEEMEALGWRREDKPAAQPTLHQDRAVYAITNKQAKTRK